MNMLIKSKPIPVSFSSSTPFIYGTYFGLTTQENKFGVSRRGGTFEDSFWDVSNLKFPIPENIYYVDVPAGESDIFEAITGVQFAKDLRDFQIPIHLVGHLKNEQQDGIEGTLLADASSNVFLCVDHRGELQMVELAFTRSNSWAIYSDENFSNRVITGPARFFMPS